MVLYCVLVSLMFIDGLITFNQDKVKYAFKPQSRTALTQKAMQCKLSKEQFKLSIKNDLKLRNECAFISISGLRIVSL